MHSYELIGITKKSYELLGTTRELFRNTRHYFELLGITRSTFAWPTLPRAPSNRSEVAHSLAPPATTTGREASRRCCRVLEFFGAPAPPSRRTSLRLIFSEAVALGRPPCGVLGRALEIQSVQYLERFRILSTLVIPRNS